MKDQEIKLTWDDPDKDGNHVFTITCPEPIHSSLFEALNAIVELSNISIIVGRTSKGE